ncbi:GumC family protein [Calothrix rhizosoleniae]|uniref:GumC family protein n=1 Tax=Calothrix rhizosoleniae TaxID=888997 RepID=UPI000B4A3C0C|nr:tyrosine-protein kinase domain-containing protein [Calothrix rhizosoleniae]
MTPPILKRYIIAFEKYKWIGIASFTLIVAGSTVVAIQPPPPTKYVASAALTYSGPTVSFSATGSQIQQQGQELRKGFLLSDAIINAVAAKVKVKAKILAKNIDLKLPRKNKAGELESTIIELKYQGTNAKQSEETLSAFMQAMIQLSAVRNTRRLEAIIKKINERLPQVKKELTSAEKKLETYDRIQGPAILAAQNGILLNGITGSQNQQRQIQLTLSGIDAQIRSLQSKLGLNVNEAYVSSALSADPILASLRSQIYQVESQMEVLRKDLRPEHPTVVQLQRQKEAAETLLQQRAGEVVGGNGSTAPLPPTVKGIRAQSNLDPARQQLANQLVALQTQKETLKQQLIDQNREEKRLRQEYSLIPNKQLERSRLEQEVLLKKAVYDKIQAKLVDAKTAEAETVSSLGIARNPVAKAPATIPRSIPITLGVGIFMGLLVGGGIIFLLGSLEGTFKTREDIRNSLKQQEVAILAEIPWIWMSGEETKSHLLPTVLTTTSPYLEFYEKLRSNIRRVGENSVKVVLITSIGSGEGKTVSSYNLGIASARAGKRTLIIETDLRSPSQCQSLQVTPNGDGNLEPLHYYSSLSECIHLVPEVENLYIVPSPGPILQSAAILESSEMRRLMEDARQRFDLVILDTNPLGISNDALLMQPYSDGMVLVTRPNYTQENILVEAVDELLESDLGLLGAVINATDIDVPSSPIDEKVVNETGRQELPSEVSSGVGNNYN